MRHFVFRLQRALRFAILNENQKKTQVAAGLQRIAYLKKYLGQLENKIHRAFETANREVHSLSGQAHFQAILPFIEDKKRFTALLEEELRALEEKQKALIRQAQRRRSLESLKEKRFDEFKLDRSRREQKAVDESQRWVLGKERDE